MTARRQAKLHDVYPFFTVEERVQLVLAAQARGDHAEAQALDDTCFSFSFPDYLAHLQALGGAATLLVVQLLASQLLLNTRLAALAEDPDARPADDPPLISLFTRQISLWRGFIAYCHDLGHDPDHVLTQAPLGTDARDPAHLLFYTHLASLRLWSDDLLLDPAQVQLWHAVFTRLFQPPESP
jgi:hypothetical protein